MLVALAAGASDAYADTRYASPAGSGSEPCAAADPCTIQDAFDEETLEDGDEVVLRPGVYEYEDTIEVDASVDVRGSRGEETFLNSRWRSIDLWNSGASITDVRLNGFLAGGEVERVVSSGCTLFDAATLTNSSCGGVVIGGIPDGREHFIDINHVSIGSGADGGTGLSLSPLFSAKTDVHIRNTVFDVSGDDLVVARSGYTNITLSNSVYQSVKYVGALYEYPTYITPPGEGSNKTYEPKLANVAAGDLRQLSDSSTVDAADSSSSGGVFDFEGQDRALGAAPDIGGDEYRAGDDLQGPAAFSPLEPKPDGYSDGSLTWERADDVDHYELTLDNRIVDARFEPSGEQVERFDLGNSYYFREEGSVHTWNVVAVDDAGGRTLMTHPGSTAPFVFRMDREPPTKPSLGGPRGSVGSAQTFYWSQSSDWGSAVDRYELFLDDVKRLTVDGSCVTTCSASLDLPVSMGSHTWRVEVIDRSGKRSVSSTNDFVVEDQTPAGVEITGHPPAYSSSPDAKFEFTATDADQVSCRLDDGVWSACESPFTVTDLSPGFHTFAVRATNAHGGDADYRNWRVVSEATAELDASPAYLATGEQTQLSASMKGLTDGEGVTSVAWDLDGDEVFETAGGYTRSAAFADSGDRVLAVRFTTNLGRVAEAEVPVSVRPAPPLETASLRIADGARLVSSRDVTLDLSWPRLATWMKVGNGAGVPGGDALALTPSMRWQLPDVDGAHVVSVRFGGMPDGSVVDRSATVVLDRQAPSVTQATLKRKRDRSKVVRVVASDSSSAIVSAEFRVRGDGLPTELRPYELRMRFGRYSLPVWVRLIDAAGNAGDWVRITPRN